MSRFANSLKVAIEYSGLTRSEVCERSGVEPASLSKYLNGRAVPKKEPLGRLTQVLSAKHRSLIYLAYIRDALPEDVEDFVFFNSPSERVNSLKDEGDEYVVDRKYEDKAKLPAELEKAFLELRKKAIAHPAVAEMILSAHRVICGGGK